MIKIAVCEDSPTDLSFFMALIDQYSAAASCELKYFPFFSGDQLIEAVERGADFDIIFFDILMPGINGIDTAKELRQIGYGSIIIFLTVTKDFALDAYSVKAHDYLLKPVTKERLFSLLDEVISESLNHLQQCLVLSRSTGLSKIQFKKIRYIEVIQKRLYFYMTDGSVFETIGTIGSMEAILLKDARFIKPHRSYIVNMDYIDTICSSEICMLDQIKIPVPKAVYTQIKEKFINYCIGSK